jgi:hypothetical protein
MLFGGAFLESAEAKPLAPGQGVRKMVNKVQSWAKRKGMQIRINRNTKRQLNFAEGHIYGRGHTIPHAPGKGLRLAQDLLQDKSGNYNMTPSRQRWAKRIVKSAYKMQLRDAINYASFTLPRNRGNRAMLEQPVKSLLYLKSMRGVLPQLRQELMKNKGIQRKRTQASRYAKELTQSIDQGR